MTAGGRAAVGDGARPATSYDGVPADGLANAVGAVRLHLFEVVGSTMDVAHALAADGAPSGTVVLADRQVAGRGRQGRRWESEAGQGVWLTLIERPRDAGAVEVLSLRAGLALAEALDPLAEAPVRLKWPNDLFVPGGKLAGILVEARWRGARPEWVALGIGVNVRPLAAASTGTLREGTSRPETLARIVPALRAAMRRPGALAPAELACYGERDLARGREVVAPVPGIVRGLDARGGIVIEGPSGARTARSGSLVFRGEAQA